MSPLRCAAPMLKPRSMAIARVPDKTAAPIYSTPEYQEWRQVVIARAGGVCQAPLCRRREPRMFADHIIELKDGGAPFDPANGRCLCGKHHSLKTAAEREKRMSARR